MPGDTSWCRTNPDGLFEEAWQSIEWDRPASTIHNQVRSWVGLRDIPRGALGTIGDERLRMTETRLMPATAASRVPPGTVLVRDVDPFVVQCADDPIAMLGWQTAQTEV